MTTAPPSTSVQGASPTRIRDGSVSGAVIGMNAETCASVPSGAALAPKATNIETRITSTSGVVADWSSSRRGTSEPAHANAHA